MSNKIDRYRREENVKRNPGRNRPNVEPGCGRIFDSGVDEMNIGGNIRRKREEAGVKQVELAERVGVTQNMLCQIERGSLLNAFFRPVRWITYWQKDPPIDRHREDTP